MRPRRKERQPRGAVPRDRRVGIGRLQRALDRRLDRTFYPAERFIMRELETAAGMVFAVEPLQGEGEQRQRVLGAARLNVGEQRIDEGSPRFRGARAVPSSRRAGPLITSA